MSHLALVEEPVVSTDVRVGKTDEMIRDWFMLQRMWAAEEYGTELDPEAWLKYVSPIVDKANFDLMVVYRDWKPVACAELHYWYDPLRQKTIGSGDEVYIDPEYRGMMIWRRIYREAAKYFDSKGVDVIRQHSRANDHPFSLRVFYEKCGYHVAGHMMEVELKEMRR